jgi:hypothetical protein
MNGKCEKMNIENEKKWFVYIGDHHEGPFSVLEVSERKNSGSVRDDSYVWCEGMNDWLMLSDVKELAQEVKKLEPAAPAPKVKAPPVNAKISPAKQNQGPAKPTMENKKATSSKKFAIYLALCLFVLLALSLGTLSALSRFAAEDVHAKIRPTLSRLIDKVPALALLFHLVPTLQDVTPDEQKDLEQARQGGADVTPKIAIALSQNDPNRPFFYVSTNLPDGTKFDVYLVGNSESLLNKLQYSAQYPVQTSKGFGKTEVYSSVGGQPIPKGEYQVVIVDSTEQEETIRAQLLNLPPLKASAKIPDGVPPNTHFSVVKNYFLGGPRDETYLTRLKQFHEKIRQNSDREFSELKQYSETLTSMYSTLTTEFNKIYTAKKPPPNLKAAWKKNADVWQQINGQLEQTVQTWSKETIQNEFFYGKVYALVKSAYESTKALFTIENGYIENPQDHATFDIQHGKALSETRDALELLRTKMDLIEKAPKSPSGLPTREGL